jgi:hypothetical protein
VSSNGRCEGGERRIREGEGRGEEDYSFCRGFYSCKLREEFFLGSFETE